MDIITSCIKWDKIRTSTQPLNAQKALETIQKCYAHFNMKAPKTVLKFSSPLAYSIAYTSKISDEFDEISNCPQRFQTFVENTVRSYLENPDNLPQYMVARADSSDIFIFNTCLSKLMSPTKFSSSELTAENVFYSSFSSMVDTHFQENKLRLAHTSALSLYSLACVDRAIQERVDISLKLVVDIATHCGHWFVYDDILMIGDRPKRLNFDQNNRMHCGSGPAIEYRDGFSIYAWHGQWVPSHWIMNTQQVVASEVLKCDNIEQRRAGCEILGWDRILNELKCEVVDEDPDPLIGTLLEVDLPDSGKERFLKVKCGTGRDFVIPVPPESPSAKWANAWTYGMQDDLGSFRPQLRT